jgi:membrane-associated protease RseP (regulator of RpoE activity)
MIWNEAGAGGLLGLLAALTVVTIWHELGHLWVARRYGVPVKLIGVGIGPAIWRFCLGGDVTFEVRALPVGMVIGVIARRAPDGQALRPVAHDLAVAAGGPLASFLLTAIFFLAAPLTRALPGLQTWLIYTGLLSAVLSTLNLLPLPGLDGGHLFLLSLAQMGLQLPPEMEAKVHHVGLRVTAIACLVVSAVMLGARLLGKG